MQKTGDENCIYEGVEALEALIAKHYNKEFSNSKLVDEQRKETYDRSKRERSTINELTRTEKVHKRQRKNETISK